MCSSRRKPASNTSPSATSGASQQLRGVGLQQQGGTLYATVLLGGDPVNATLTLHFPGKQSALTLQQGANPREWKAVVGPPGDVDLTSVGVATEGAHVIVSIPAGSVRGLSVTTAAGDRLPYSGYVLPVGAPSKGLDLVDLILLVVLIGALFYGWRRGLANEARLALAAVITLLLAFLLFPEVSRALVRAAGSKRVGDALGYGILIGGIAVLGVLIARVIMPRLRFGGQLPPWLERNQRPVAAGIAGVRILVLAAMGLAVIASLAPLDFASESIQTSATGSALVSQWDRYFPVATVNAGGDAQPSAGGGAQATGPLYPAAAAEFARQVQAVTTLAGYLMQLSRLQAIGVATWVRQYDADLASLANASNAVRASLGLPST
jgi:zinc transporter ZupT